MVQQINSGGIYYSDSTLETPDVNEKRLNEKQRAELSGFGTSILGGIQDDLDIDVVRTSNG
jgi:hypothetical protein